MKRRLLVIGFSVGLTYALANRLWQINRRMMVENSEGLGHIMDPAWP